LRASADGLQPAETVVAVQAAALPAVPEGQPVVMVGGGWRISPPQADRPDPGLVLADSDMNSWGWGAPPLKQAPEALRWRTYRAQFGLRADRNDGRGQLVFREIAGKAEVWVDGVRLGGKTTAEPGPLSVTLPKGPGWRTLTVLVEAQPGQHSGVTGAVLVEPGKP